MPSSWHSYPSSTTLTKSIHLGYDRKTAKMNVLANKHHENAVIHPSFERSPPMVRIGNGIYVWSTFDPDLEHLD